MKPGIYNFTIYQGATFSRQILIKKDGDPMPLEGYKARMQIRDYNTKALIFELTTDKGNLPLDESTSRIDILMSSVDTESFNFKKAKYNIELYSGITVIRILQGDITLDRDVNIQ